MFHPGLLGGWSCQVSRSSGRRIARPWRYLDLKRERFSESLEELYAAEAVLRAAHRLPKWLQAVHDIVDAILPVPWGRSEGEQAAAAADRVTQLLRASDNVVERVPGFLPSHYLACAWFEWASVEYPRARRFLAEGQRFAEEFENPGALADAERLEALLDAAPAG